MIGYLEGTVLARSEGTLLLRTPAGVGYQVHVPLPLLAEAPPAGGPLALYVVTVMRDNELALYGFADLEGKALFELLTRASGVGPRLALAFLSAFSPAELKTAIARQDTALLATIPGVGRKTAGRLCLELADKLAREPFAADGGPPGGRSDLISALTNLGYPEKDVVPVVRRLADQELPFADQLRQALSLLARH